MSQYVAEAKQIIRSHKYVMLTANWCPDCVYANSIWRKYGVLNKVSQFEVGGYDRDKLNKYRDAFAEVAGIRNLPTIFVDGKVWGTEAELHKFEREGTLLEELKKIGLIN
ncbi:glutathione-disulfide reductase GRX8 [Lachancea thermotolerans CBS 6340]|uniref:KLTH0D13420p n=1 Tax=Lachancea thermotolerans (strain ATCC 56472 / CBS 6340 / NRRL Y-8284) TaxID=559295 RepID=C5DFA0_LACTC|nr:KLTH0D13420p [Lachancea thermotolerans CBS 6340]CAR22855.1 KLTH0D13420p [Lachancea thermotolerans CBS 6340]